MKSTSSNRRKFIMNTATLGGIGAFGLISGSLFSSPLTVQEGIHIIGPKPGLSPHLGTLVSMMDWMRMVVTRSVENLTKRELDYVHDPKSNSIGAMLLHLAATERIYQEGTMDNPVSFVGSDNIDWDAAMGLGEKGRKQIRGNDLSYYLDILAATREWTIREFKKRDDEWLFKVDPNFFQGKPTNNYCKWFHVCEHESNHNGQIKWIKGRLPGAKDEND